MTGTHILQAGGSSCFPIAQTTMTSTLKA